MLLTELGGTACGIVGHVCADVVQGGKHLRERARGAHTLLRHMLHVIDRDAVLSIKFPPGALGKHVERGADERAAQVRKVEGALYLILLELILPSPADAPHVADRKEAEGLEPFVVRINHAAVVITRIAFGKLACHLREGLRTGYADAHRHTQATENRLVEILTPRLEIHVLHAVKHTETLIDGVTMKLGAVSAHDVHQPSGHVRIELIIGRESIDLMAGKKLSQLKIRRAFLDAELLGFIAPCHDTAIVIGQHDDGLSVQIRTERALTTDITVVYIHECPISAFHSRLSMTIPYRVLHDSPQRELVSAGDLDMRVLLVGRNKLHISILLMRVVEIFDGEVAIDKPYHNITFARLQRAVYDDDVILVDACVDHGVAHDTRIESCIRVLDEILVEVERLGLVLLGR